MAGDGNAGYREKNFCGIWPQETLITVLVMCLLGLIVFGFVPKSTKPNKVVSEANQFIKLECKFDLKHDKLMVKTQSGEWYSI